MSEENDTRRFDRRSVLKTIGAASAIGASSASASALEGTEKSDRIQEALETDSFETFASEIGDVEVDTDAGRVTQRGKTGKRIVRVELQTNLGKMGVLMLEGSDESVDITLLDLSTANTDAVPERYADVPRQTKPLLFTTSDWDEVELHREATQKEKKTLARKMGVAASDLKANFETKRGGFVVSGGSELSGDDYAVVTLDEMVFHEVSASRIAGQSIEKKQVSAQLDWWCTYRCGSCITKASGCIGCCLAVYIGCIACIIWNCGLGANACYDCYDCLS